MEGRPAPVLVNNSLEGHPLVSALFKISKFRPIMSGNTPQSSRIFPSLKSSCLIVDLEVLVNQQDQFQKIMESCLHFITTNTRPFILLTPSSTSPGRDSFSSSTDGYSSVNNLIFHLSQSQGCSKTPVVVQAWSQDLAVRSILYLVFKTGKAGGMMEQLPSEGEMRARLVSALNQELQTEDCQSLLDPISSLANLPSTVSNLSHQMKSALVEDRSF